MGFFDFLKGNPSDERLINNIIEYVYEKIQTKQGVRVEDALSFISVIVAERCIKVANEYSIESHEYNPGDAVFSNQINEILVGNIVVDNWEELHSDSVFGKVRDEIKHVIDLKNFPPLHSIFENYIQNIEKAAWGNLRLNIPDDHNPFILPLQAAYESRGFIDQNIHIENDQKTLDISISALSGILIQTKHAIDTTIALTLVFETINGMSKMAPMTNEKMEEISKQMKK